MGINFQNVVFKYSKKASKNILDNVNININKNDEFIMIVGETGSGKSTLVQHMNALLLPTSGEIHIYDKVIKPKSKIKLKENEYQNGYGTEADVLTAKIDLCNQKIEKVNQTLSRDIACLTIKYLGQE